MDWVNMNKLNMINWSIFVLLILVGIVTVSITVYELTLPPTFPEDTQSRIEFRWGSLHTILLIVILVVSFPVAMGWKRLSPFNVPIAIILAGFCYELFFLTFTVGWVGIQGMLGFVVAFLIGGILILSYSVAILIEHRKIIKR